ncbi:bioY family protein [marine actinobacterium PHSC20C1]|nr:bioY family protein [marine actinobacterium PHSC20C1]
MSSLSLRLKPTIVDRVFERNVASNVVFITLGAALTAIAAQYLVPLYPVPVTAQTLAVMLVGMSLGAVRGALSMLLYISLGALGLPVFSNLSGGLDVLSGPSGGYIVGYVASAWVVGIMAERHWDRTFWRAIASGAIATLFTFAFGILGLSLTFQRMGADNDIGKLFEVGVAPLLVGAAIKVTIVAVVLSCAWKALGRYRPEPSVQS